MTEVNCSHPVSRRSCLSTPANVPRKLEKASTIGDDEVIVDLEDSVPVDRKAEALGCAAAALSAWDGGAVAVRVNAPGTPWCHTELVALAELPGPPLSVVVPKVEGAGDLAFVDRLLAGAEAAAGRTEELRIQALIETATGLARVDEIAAASDRLEALILGYADLAASLGRPAASAVDPGIWLAAQERVLVTARTSDLQAIDGPFLGTSDDESFRAAARRAVDLGFDGKWAIHPSQVPTLNELFSPSGAEVERARAVVAALLEGEARTGAGAVELDGLMLDEAVRRWALRVLARAEASA